MPRAIDFTCDVDEAGHIPAARRRFVADQLRMYAGGQVRIRLSKPKRSTRANSFYWAGVIDPIKDAMNEAGAMVHTSETGAYSPVTSKMVHDMMKKRHLGYESVEVCHPTTGEVIYEATELRSSASLDSTDFSDYIEAIRQDELTRALGVWIEEPAGITGRIAEPA